MDNELEDFEKYNIKEWIKEKINLWSTAVLFYYINDIYAEKNSVGNQINRKEYKTLLKQIDVLENDEDIQEAIWEKIQEIEYDEDSIESRAIAVHSIGNVLYASEFLKKLDENDYPIDNELVEIINDLKIDDVMQLIEWVDFERIMQLPKVRNTLLEKVSKMSDGQLLVFFANFNSSRQFYIDVEARKKLSERILKSTNGYLPFYMKYLSFDDEILSKCLDLTEKNMQVNAIVSADVHANHNKEVTEKLQKMLQNLSDSEFVRYMCSAATENEKLKPIVIERMKQLSKEDIRFLTAIYFELVKPPLNPYKHNKLAELAGSYDLIKENENGVPVCWYDEKVVIPKFKIYCYSNRYFDALPYFSGFDFAKVDADNPEMTEQYMLEAFERNSKTMENYYKFIDFIGTLSKSKDEDLYKTILDINKYYNFSEDMDQDLISYYKFTELYLVNRILNMKNENLLKRLYLLSQKDLPLFDVIMVKMQEKGFSEPESLKITGDYFSNMNNSKNSDGKEKEQDNNGLDNLKDRE